MQDERQSRRGAHYGPAQGQRRSAGSQAPYPPREAGTQRARPPYTPGGVEVRGTHAPYSPEGVEPYEGRTPPGEAPRREPPPVRLSPAERAKREKEEKKSHKKRNREKRLGNRMLFRVMWLAMVIIAGLTLGQYLNSGFNDMLAIDRLQTTVTVDIPQDASTDEIAQVLRESGVINKTDFFILYSRLTKSDGSYNFGTYEISTGMDYEAIINHLQSTANRVDTVKITFPEGVNLREIAKLMEDNGVCEAQEVLDLANSQDFQDYELINAITNDWERYYLLEGYLFPDTYDFYIDENPRQALSKLLSNCGKKLTEDYRERAEELGMTVDEVMTLASIIQAEAADTDDMYLVSSVLHNRLDNGAATGTAQLGCDTTVYYPYRSRSQVPPELAATFASRYDTYTLVGLPPGPICSPGTDAIDAALYPEDTDYYYFCHSKEGEAFYAETAQEHQSNLQKAGLVQ